MYMPPHFEETDLARLHAMIEGVSLGAVVVAGDQGLQADHIPFVLDAAQGPCGTLLGHVARSNHLWKLAAQSPTSALVIFQGPSAYISPGWYPTKQQTHEVVPTYNYAVVHAFGTIVVHDDERWLRAQASRLTRKMESGQAAPWKMGDAPPDFLDKMLAQIVGIEIVIDRLEGKWKMSQNRNAADRAGVVTGLMAGSASEQEAAHIVAERES